MPHDFTGFSHQRLIAFLASEPRDTRDMHLAEQEYWQRYHRHICRVLQRECKRLHFNDGIQSIDDLANDVHHKLFRDDRKALKKFRGNHDHSFFKYLSIVANRVALNAWKKSLGSRHAPPKGFISLDPPKTAKDGPGHESISPIEFIDAGGWQDDAKKHELYDAIAICLEEILKSNKNKHRNKIIFYMMFSGKFSTEEIAKQSGCGLSAKRISNIYTLLKGKLQECMRGKGYEF